MQLKTAINLLVTVSLLTCLRSIGAEIFEECDGIEPGTYVASLTDCATFIYCNDEDSRADQCDEGYYFDGEMCDEQDNVYCALDAVSTDDEGEEETEEVEEEPQTTVRTTTTTLRPETTTSASSDETTIFDALTIPPIIKDRCPQTDDPNQIILLANSQSCTDYYLCYHGHAIEMHCTNHLHFNTHTGRCDFPENVHCLHDRPHANKCLPHMTDFFPHPENCNYFYYCIKGFMTVQQCPFYYGWDVEKRSCVQLSQAKCYSSAKKKLSKWY